MQGILHRMAKKDQSIDVHPPFVCAQGICRCVTVCVVWACLLVGRSLSHFRVSLFVRAVSVHRPSDVQVAYALPYFPFTLSHVLALARALCVCARARVCRSVCSFVCVRVVTCVCDVCVCDGCVCVSVSDVCTNISCIWQKANLD